MFGLVTVASQMALPIYGWFTEGFDAQVLKKVGQNLTIGCEFNHDAAAQNFKSSMTRTPKS
jgi:hypothetical protein